MIALIADDLTGASDAGVQFARRGLSTRVLFDLTDVSSARNTDALAIDTDTRAVPAKAAYARVHALAECLHKVQPEHVYKKVDSTLRGHLGAEIDAVMDALDFALAIVAPAFPTLGRTTRNGVHHLRGVPIHETEIGRDPKAPVHESNLVRLLECESRRKVDLIPLAVIRESAESVRRSIDERTALGAALIVCDAESEDDMRAIACSVADRPDVLWVGSAGLAEHLVESLALPRRTLGPLQRRSSPGPVLLVCGSVSEVTRRQIATLLERRAVVAVEMDPSAIISDPESRHREMQRCQRILQDLLHSGDDCVLAVAPDRVDAADVSAQIADALGTMAAACTRSDGVGGLILTGGDTARAVCRHLEVTGIELLSEIEPGVPLGRLVGRTPGELLAVTKAGAFGTDGTLANALDHLKGAR